MYTLKKKVQELKLINHFWICSFTFNRLNSNEQNLESVYPKNVFRLVHRFMKLYLHYIVTSV